MYRMFCQIVVLVVSGLAAVAFAHEPPQVSVNMPEIAGEGRTPYTSLEMLNVVLRNHSDATFELKNRSEYTFMSQGDDLKLLAHGTLELVVKTGQRLNAVALPFAVRNALVAPKTHAQWVLNLKL